MPMGFKAMGAGHRRQSRSSLWSGVLKLL